MGIFGIVYMVLAFLVSCVFASVVIPNILVVSFKKKLFDLPDARKVHTTVVPRLGGVAFMPIIVFAVSFVLGASLLDLVSAPIGILVGNQAIFVFGLCSLILLYLVGMKDDLVGVSYSTKFMVQVICGSLIAISGLRVDDLFGFLFLADLYPIFASAVTIFLVVFIVNALNLIDGIDGLASGLSIIALLYYGVCFAMVGRWMYAIMAFASMGVLVPFFYYNVFGSAEHCRKIFMGDTGALTIGFVLAFLSIRMLSLDNVFGGNPLFVAFAPLIVPCFDVVRVALYRMSHGNHPFKPDRNHLHHKFLDAGVSHYLSLISILVVSVIFTLSVVWSSKYLDVNVVAILLVASWMAFNYGLKKFKDARLKKSPAPKK
ncbi:MAG: MraY family glycosyltransferase [Rikenellaceae bacterium]